MKARRFCPRTGPNSSKAGYVDHSPKKPAPVLKAYCRCGSGRPCLITAHQAPRA